MARSDKSLLLLISEKDNDAFEQFYNRYIKLLYKFVYRILQEQQATDDLIQEFWLKVWEDPTFLKCNAEGSARSYMLQYMKFRILDLYRKLNNNLVVIDVGEEVEKEESVMYNNIIENLSEKELINVIIEALQDQSPMIRRTFWMRINNYSVRETAKKLSVTPKTVYNRYSESLAVVRKHILNVHSDIIENLKFGIKTEDAH